MKLPFSLKLPNHLCTNWKISDSQIKISDFQKCLVSRLLSTLKNYKGSKELLFIWMPNNIYHIRNFQTKTLKYLSTYLE